MLCEILARTLPSQPECRTRFRPPKCTDHRAIIVRHLAPLFRPMSSHLRPSRKSFLCAVVRHRAILPHSHISLSEKCQHLSGIHARRPTQEPFTCHRRCIGRLVLHIKPQMEVQKTRKPSSPTIPSHVLCITLLSLLPSSRPRKRSRRHRSYYRPCHLQC